MFPSLRKLVLIVLLLLPIWAAGCSGSDAPLTTATGNTLVQNQNTFTLKSDLQILPADGSVVVEEITDDTVTLSGDIPDIKVGGALMMNSGPQQFIRRVVSVQRQGDLVIVTTTPGSIFDVFESANIVQTETLGPDVLRTLHPTMEGVTIGEPRQLSRQERLDTKFDWALPINFNNAALTDRNGNVLARANGKIEVSFGFDTDLQFNARKFLNPPTTLEHLKLVPFVQATGHLEVEALAAGDFEKEYTVAAFDGGIPLAGFGPVSINANLELLAYANGQVNVSGTTTFDANVHAEFGLEAFDGNFQIVNPAPLATFNVTPPDLQGTADFSLSLARPRFSIGVLGLGNVNVKADAVRAHVHAEFTNNPQPGYSIGAEGEVEVLVGALIQIGPFGIPPFQTPTITIVNQSYPIAKFAYSLGNPNPTFIPRTTTPPVLLFNVVNPLSSTTLRPGEYALAVDLGYVQFNPFVIVPIPQDVNWVSSNTNVLNPVISNGVVTLVQARQAGTARLTADHPTIDGALDFTVSATPLSSLRIEPPGATLTNQQSSQARAIGTYADGTQVDVTDFVDWASSNSNIAIISPRGLVQPGSQGPGPRRGGLVQSGSNGQVTLSASFQGQTASAGFGINTPRFLTFSLVSGNARAVNFLPSPEVVMQSGDGLQLQALSLFADGSIRFTTKEVSWSSEDGFVADVDPATGELNAFFEGYTVIHASLNGIERSFRVRVGQPTVTSLELSPTEAQLAAGQKVPLNVFANFPDGSRRDVTAIARVRNLLPEVASYDATTHEVTAQRAGLSLIYVTYGGQGAVLPVTVLPAASNFVFVANSGDNTIASQSVGADGSLSAVTGSPFAVPDRPSGLTRLGDFLISAISGNGPNSNELFTFQIDSGTGSLTPVGTPASLASATFQPLPTVGVGADGLVSVQSFDSIIKLFILDTATGNLIEHDSLAMTGNGAAEVTAHPGTLGNPDFVLTCNSGSNNVSVYRVDLNNGVLTEVAGSPFANPQAGDFPGGIEVVQNNVYLTNLIGNSISAFAMDPATGVLTPGAVTPSGGTNPSRMTHLETAARLFLYVANTGTADVNAFEVNPVSGALTPLAGFPVPAGGANPHDFTEVTLGNGNLVFYLTTSNDVSGFSVDTATGALTNLTGSPFTGFNSPAAITH